MEYRPVEAASLRLDIGRADHLPPLFGFTHDELNNSPETWGELPLPGDAIVTLTVVRLTTRSNLVGCSTGISPGLCPAQNFVDLVGIHQMAFSPCQPGPDCRISNWRGSVTTILQPVSH